MRKFKTKYCSPYFIIGGDFNKRKIKRELKEFQDIKLVETGPTRGTNTLDLIFTNFPEFVKNYGTIPALFNNDGVKSDHASLYIHSRIPRVPDYTVEKYTYVKQTPEGDVDFSKFIECTNWSKIVNGTNPDTMVADLHKFFEEAMRVSYQTITTTRKSSQPQWINQRICLLYTSPSPRDRQKSRMPSSA